MVEQEKQALLKANADRSLSEELQKQAPAPKERTDTAANSVGRKI
jgi:hypothetical protein